MTSQRKKLVSEISKAVNKIATLVRNADTSIKIPNSEWTIGDMTAHVIVTQNILNSLISGKRNSYIKNKNNFIEDVSHNISRQYIANINKKFLTKYTQRNGTILAKAFNNEYQSLFRDSEEVLDTKKFVTHYGEVDLLVLFSYCLTHLLIHGCAVAKTLNEPLPGNKNNTSLTIPFIKVIMVKLYDKKAARSFTANFVLCIKDVETFSLLCTPEGVVIVNSVPQDVDCSITMDSLTFFLVSNGYMSQWKALLLGKVSLGGKKPWLAIKLSTLFKGL